MDLSEIDAAWYWAIAALLLGTAELLAPGVFLLFLAIAAALTALLTWAIEPPALFQFLAFAALAAGAVAGGRRWYVDNPVRSSDPYLNDRGRRMIGAEVRAATPFEHGRGRVRIGDAEWLARGPDCTAGTCVRVVEVDGATLVVEPVGAEPMPR